MFATKLESQPNIIKYLNEIAYFLGVTFLHYSQVASDFTVKMGTWKLLVAFILVFGKIGGDKGGIGGNIKRTL